jgi:hypothetical protein
VAPDEDEGFPSYAFLLRDKDYDLAHIKSADRRHNIRRGLKHTTVERISFQLLLRQGAQLISDTYQRQGRNCGSSVISSWQNYCSAAETNPLFRAWGAFVGKELAATKIEFVFQGGVHPEALFSRTDLLKYYTMNALLFVSTRDTMRSDDISYICHGLRPVTGEKESLINFKESMGLGMFQVKERLEINPLMKPLFNKLFRELWAHIPENFNEKSEYLRLLRGIACTIAQQIRLSR